MPKVSVIIPVYNALDDLKILLNSLIENFNFNLGEIFLINDFSNEQTTEYLKKFSAEHSKFQLINNKENLGFVKSCNKGMQKATGDIIVLLNSDTQIPAEFCERIIKCFESNLKIGIASPISSASELFFISLPRKYTLQQMNEKLRKKHKCSYPVIHAAEGFCFCIRREVIEQQGYLDEIYGKGYHEEVDFAYRAITNGWINVLIDDLYVYHKRQASFGKWERRKQIKKNDKIYLSRWEGFRDEYEKKYNLKNPMEKIKFEMFPLKMILINLFSIRNSYDKKHKIITLLGCKLNIRLKHKNKYPWRARNIKQIFNQNIRNNKIAAVMAMHNNNAILDDNLIKYLAELHKYVGYIILSADHPIIPEETEKVKNLVDAIIFKKHNEYDFGSYKRGYFLLKKIGILNDVSNLLFVNDSVVFVGNSLEQVFNELEQKDFYGITQNSFGFIKTQKKYGWGYAPHIQSYFVSFSKNIFKNDWFDRFVNNIKKEKIKEDIIFNYEMGLSKLISLNGFSLNSFYPPIKEDENPCYLHLCPENAEIFIKKSLM